MIYEAEVTFTLLQPLIFRHQQDATKLEKGKTYHYLICPDRDKLLFMTTENYVLCRLYLGPYDVEIDENSSQMTISMQQNRDKNDHNYAPPKQIIAQIKTTKMCMQQIQEICPRRKYKSCLSFAPSSVQHISILSGESPTQRFRGFINLIAIFFVVLNLRNIIDNFLFYGARFTNTPLQFIPLESIIGFCLMFLFIEFAYFVDRLRFGKIIKESLAKRLLIGNIVLLLVYLVCFCRKFLEGRPLSALGFTALGVVFCLKLISYMQVNNELFALLRKTQQLSSHQFNSYVFANHQISQQNLALLANNKQKPFELLTHSRLLYFLIAPTLCYQLSYPRTTSIRYSWVLKRLIEFTLISALQLVIWVQYIEPQLSKWFSMMQQGRYSSLEILNRLLRLSIPNTIAWITAFYSFFHLFLNIISELLTFGDRNFYMDWWNCRNLQEYWKTWNLPVHFWFIRHCYNPLLRKGISRISANLIVFTLSAVAHEFLVCVPLGIVSHYAFLAMLLQAPAMFLEKKLSKMFNLSNSELGNVSFWLFFCVLGQPTCMFIYYSLYMQKIAEGTQLLASTSTTTTTTR